MTMTMMTMLFIFLEGRARVFRFLRTPPGFVGPMPWRAWRVSSALGPRRGPDARGGPCQTKLARHWRPRSSRPWRTCRACWDEPPALRGRQRHTGGAHHDLVGSLRPCQGAEALVARFPVPLPPPGTPVTMACGRALEALPRFAHEVRDLVREVLVLALEGPDGQDVPEDLVGLGAPGGPEVREEQEVPDGLVVQLEVLEDLDPQVFGPQVMPTLDVLPVPRQLLTNPEEELVLEEAEMRVFVVPEDPEQTEAPGMAPMKGWRGSRTWVEGLEARAGTCTTRRTPPLLVGGLRRPTRRWLRWRPPLRHLEGLEGLWRCAEGAQGPREDLGKDLAKKGCGDARCCVLCPVRSCVMCSRCCEMCPVVCCEATSGYSCVLSGAV